jgi:cell division protein FtsI/penicillin-binding protein 2
MAMRPIFEAIRRSKSGVSLALLLVTVACAKDLRAADDFQTIVNHVMQGKAGAVIVSDPRTGRILALWNSQIAFKEAYTPGSTAKLVVSAAALEEGVLSPSEKIMCRRVPRLLGESFRCSHPIATQPFDLADALSNSCNYFFSELSTRLSSSTLTHWYGVFGYGAAGEDDLPGEVLIPDKPRGKALAALGDQGVTATPAQVLLAYSAIATKGQVFRLIMPDQRKAPSLDRVITLHRTTFAILTEGLRDCVKNGSCRAAAVPGVSVAGKTGTAPALDGSHVTHAWFVGFAPVEAPEVALVIFLKRGTGGANAAPLAAQILKQYFSQKAHTP